jgi:N-acetylmuramoyl-L-alanine amidase
MSAGPSKAPQGLTREQTPPILPVTARPHFTPSGPDAFQALLAFASLHAQIRESREPGAARAGEDRWQGERFLLDEVLQLVAERALAITGADGIAIALAEGSEIVCRGSAGAIAPDAGARLDPNSGFSGSCFRSGQMIRCDDAEHDLRVNLQAALLLGARSMVAVPLAGRNCVIGLLEAFSYEAYGFNDSDVRSLNLLAELILAALRPEEEDRLAEISRQVRARAMEPVAPLEIAVGKPPVQSSGETQTTGEPDSAASENRPAEEIAAAAEFGEETSRPGLMVVAAVLLVAVALGFGVWRMFAHSNRSLRASIPAGVVPANTAEGPVASSEIDDTAPQEDPGAMTSPPDTEEKTSLLPQVTGVRHWSSADSSTVVIDLQDQIQYEAHKLANPERIYFDLHDTTLMAGLIGKTIEVGDSLLTRIRVAQPVAGVTRIVLDTKAGSSFSVSLKPNPYRLVAEVRATGAKADGSGKIDLFSPPAPVNTPNPAAASTPVPPIQSSGPRIVLDAGHGGWDLGTVGRQGLLEKDLTLDIVDRLGNLLEKRLGAEVIYTRQDDNYIALDRRAEIANQAQADLFISIHANNSDSTSARGVETYYTNTFSSVHAYSHDNAINGKLQTVGFANVDIRDKVMESRKIAVDIQRALYGALAAKNPGIRDRGVKKASYVVLTGTSMPAVLAEVSFVSSPTDETNLQSATYRQGIAEALYKGIVRYTDTQRNVKIAKK